MKRDALGVEVCDEARRRGEVWRLSRDCLFNGQSYEPARWPVSARETGARDATPGTRRRPVRPDAPRSYTDRKNSAGHVYSRCQHVSVLRAAHTAVSTTHFRLDFSFYRREFFFVRPRDRARATTHDHIELDPGRHGPHSSHRTTSEITQSPRSPDHPLGQKSRQIHSTHARVRSTHRQHIGIPD